MDDIISLRDEFEERQAARTFKEKVEIAARDIVKNWNWISIPTLYSYFFENFGWDKSKIRYAIKLLLQWNALIDVGWAQTLAINKGFGKGTVEIYCKSKNWLRYFKVVPRNAIVRMV